MTATDHMLLAICLLGLYTVLTTLRFAHKRFFGVRTGRTSSRRFIANATQEGLPDDMVIASRHYSNLFEMPTLFYAVTVGIMAAGRADMVFAYIAYVYVAARLVHGYIHLGYNRVFHRFAAFGLSMLVLAIMLVRLALVLTGAL